MGWLVRQKRYKHFPKGVTLGERFMGWEDKGAYQVLEINE